MRSTMLRVAGVRAVSAARTAYPSIEEFGQGGISRRESTGSASTRPSAARTSTRSVSNARTHSNILASASSTVSTPCSLAAPHAVLGDAAPCGGYAATSDAVGGRLRKGDEAPLRGPSAGFVGAILVLGGGLGGHRGPLTVLGTARKTSAD